MQRLYHSTGWGTTNQFFVIGVLCLLVLPRALGQTRGAKQKPAITGDAEKAVEKLVDQYVEAAKKET